MDLKDKLTHPVFRQLAQIAQQTGLETYVVGGFVRDLLLGRSCKDLDFVCLGSGIQLAEAVSQLPDAGQLTVFKNFGTAMVRFQDLELEFVGARKESYRRDSRKPIVEDGSLADDQQRRDFTINALAISLNPANYGQLIDPFGGVAHLQKKSIVTPLKPEQTFSDDPLRMMRAIRFATQLDFDIDPDTFEAICQQAKRLEIVSMERIMVEFNKIIMAKTPSYGFKLLDAAGLLELFFPEFVELKGAENRDGRSHKDNFYHTLQVLDNISRTTDSLWLRWAAILHDIAKPATKRFHPKAGWTFHGHEDKGARMVPGLFRRMRLPLDHKMKYVQKLVKLHLRPIALAKKEVTDSAVRRLLSEAGDDFEDLMKLCRADITTKAPQKAKKYLANFDLVEERVAALEEKDQIRNFQPVITGEVIMETFGLKPSKQVGIIKSYIREAMLDGEIPNELAPAKQLMIRYAAKMGIKPVDQQADSDPDGSTATA